MTQVTLNADRSKVLVAMNANQISFADAKLALVLLSIIIKQS